MFDLQEYIDVELNALSSLGSRIGCGYTARYLQECRKGLTPGFYGGALDSFYADLREVRYSTDISNIYPPFMYKMRGSAVGSANVLLERMSEEPSKKARYRRLGLMPFDVERTWFLKRFNDDVEKFFKTAVSPNENPELFVRKVFKIYSSFASNILKPYSQIYRYCMRNLLGTNAKDLASLIEENFSMDDVFEVNGRPVSDIRYLRRMFREKRYVLMGRNITFQGPKGPITYDVLELLLMVIFVQKKIFILCSLFCIADVEKMRQFALLQAQN
ncbi:MAG: hypothetical protein MJZ38_05230 [archaeon]|nr:hypothetical protein [archaeon]